MRIKMLRTRNYTPREERRITVKYREGCGYTVKRSWGEDMVRDGDAVEVKPLRRRIAPVDVIAPAEPEADGPRG